MNHFTPEKKVTAPVEGAKVRRLPDAELCRARHTGFADHVNCLTPHQWSCEYAIPFGVGYLCVHADRCGIAARTADAESLDQGK